MQNVLVFQVKRTLCSKQNALVSKQNALVSENLWRNEKSYYIQ